MNTNTMKYHLTKIKSRFFKKRMIPEDDLINEKFDVEGNHETKEIILILSTPRSGSTLFCDLLRVNRIAIPHEYFQPHKFIPILATRWGVNQPEDNLEEYGDHLLKNRTLSNCILGCNLHATHIKYYLKSGLLNRFPHKIVHVSRESVEKQAISYEVAHQSKQWTSSDEEQLNAEYNFNSIKKRMYQITEDNLAIEAFLKNKKLPYSKVIYEGFIENKQRIIENTLDIKIDDFKESKMKKQSINQKAEFLKKFRRDLLTQNGLSVK